LLNKQIAGELSTSKITPKMHRGQVMHKMKASSGPPETQQADVLELRAEEALRKSEERWRSVFENSAIGVALTDLNGRFGHQSFLPEIAGLHGGGTACTLFSRRNA
jgi:hypothetical protein